MSHLKNFLRAYRRKTHITQFDIAFLLAIDHTSISRQELSKREPNLKVILAYQILFNAPILQVFNYHKNEMRKQLLKTIPQLLEMLQAQEPTANVASRIVELEDMLRKVTEQVHGEN